MDIFINSLGVFTLGLIVFVILGRILKFFRGLSKYNLEKKWIVVTGCDSGIGKGVMEKLIADDAYVVACTYTEAGADNAMAAGAKHALRFDLADEEATRKAAQDILTVTDGNIWGLVHNAGMVQPGFLEYLTIDVYRKILELNFFAIVRLTQPLVQALKAARGRLVIISSVDGIVSLPGNAPYDAAKFAVEAYGDAARVELSFFGVDVSIINPSTMKTPLAMGFFELHRKSWSEMNEINPDGAWKQYFTPTWLDKFVEQGNQSLEMIAQDPAHTVSDISHALSAKHPQMRYLSGTTAKTLFYALWKMPEEWSFEIKKRLVFPPPENPVE